MLGEYVEVETGNGSDAIRPQNAYSEIADKGISRARPKPKSTTGASLSHVDGSPRGT